MNIQDIPPALRLARELIVEGAELAAAVDQAAAEFAINPKLVERKLSESHGVPAAELVALLRARAAEDKTPAQMLEEARARQREAAARNAAEAEAVLAFFRTAARRWRFIPRKPK